MRVEFYFDLSGSDVRGGLEEASLRVEREVGGVVVIFRKGGVYVFYSTLGWGIKL